MTTLNQFFDEAEDALGTPLTKEARMHCVKEWLQKKLELTKLDGIPNHARAFTYRELLEELKDE